MALKLIYSTNIPEIALLAESAGVDRIFVDMEQRGKAERQKGRNAVLMHHSLDDIKKIRSVIRKAELLVRVNPIYEGSDVEINTSIDNGADILMLPYFKTVEEVKTFLECVNGRCKTLLLFETKEAVNLIDEILSLGGIDEVYIGFNDLSISTHKKFLFEPLADGTVDEITAKFKKYNMPFGFGGIASLGRGLLHSEYVIREHYRLGSSCVILSRSFCNISDDYDYEAVKYVFMSGVNAIRQFEMDCVMSTPQKFEENRLKLQSIVKEIVEDL